MSRRFLFIPKPIASITSYMLMANWNNGQAMRKSVNSGVNFTPFAPGFSPRDCFVSKDANYMYAMLESSTTLNDGIYKSTDKGATWAYKQADPARKSYPNRLFSSADGKYVIFTNSLSYSPYTGYFYISSDFGETWTIHNEFGALKFMNCHMSANGQYMGCTVDATSQFYISTNYGVTWTKRTDLSSRYYRAIGTSGDGKYWLAAISNSNLIYASSDFGATWADKSIPNARTYIQIDLSYDGKYQFALSITGSVVLRSGDFGATWTEIALGPTTGYSISCSSDGKYVLVGTNGDSYLSTDFGVNFSIVPSCGAARGVSIEKIQI